MKKSILLIVLAIGTAYSMEKQAPASPPSFTATFFSRFFSSSTNSQVTTPNPHAAFVQQLTPQQLHDAYKTWQLQSENLLQDSTFCAITDDKKLLISGTNTGKVSFYSYETGEFIADFTTAITSNQYFSGISPDNKYIFLTDSTQGTVWVYDISNPSSCFLYKTLEGHEQWVTRALVKENLVITSGCDGTIKLWDLNTQDSNAISTTRVKRGEIQQLLLSPKSNYIFSQTVYEGTEVWDISDKKTIELAAVITHEYQLPKDIVKIQDCYYLICYKGKDIRLQRLDIGQPTTEIATLGHKFGNSGAVSHVFVPDVNYLIVGTDDRALYIWSLENPSVPRCLSEIQVDLGERAISAIAVQDNKFLFAGTWEGTIYIWDIQNPAKPTLLNKFKAHSPKEGDCYCGIIKLKIMPNNKLLTFGQDCALKMWQLPT